MSLDHIPKNLLSKIQALLRLEASAKELGSIEEAANASSKIREILQKHNLDIYQVQAAGDQPKKEAEITHTTFDTMDLTKPHEGKWVRTLTNIIARYNMCEVLGVGRTEGQIWIIGTTTNVEVVWYMVEQLVNRFRVMAKATFKTYEGKEKRNTYIRGYYLGACNGIQQQLAEAAAKEKYKATQATQSMMNNTEPTESQSTSLAIASMTVQSMRKNEAYLNQVFGKVETKAVHTRSKSIGGRQQGLKDGKSIAIHGGVGAGSSQPQQRRIGNG